LLRLLPLGVFLLAVGIALSAPSALALEIRVSPPDSVFVTAIHRSGGVYDLLIQNIVVVNPGPDSVAVDSFRVELSRQGTTFLTEAFTGALLERMWEIQRNYFTKPGVQEAEESTFQFHQLLGDTIGLAPSGLTLPSKTAMFIMKEPFTTRVPPDVARLTATGTERGKPVRTELTLKVAKHSSPNDYWFPLRGRWYVNAASSFQSHHRWRPAHEFALDLLQIGAGGSSFQGKGTKHVDYYAFGQDVFAVADGTVLTAQNGYPETDLPHPGESPDDFAERVLTPMWDKDPSGALATGNTVVIQHAGNEYSFYCHLQSGSVRVHKGDHVTRGQVIAKVGMSGDGRQPHLHFQIGDSPNPTTSRAFPLVFSNIKPVSFTSTIDTEGKRVLQTGEFVETVSPQKP
jgi:murein DD-endopeptidase MepM/ murein hydrolase activator NlpD